ncbi:hypothetical protein [Variovorax sp. DAIF25]|uniref:hypothetical protein n=1 Tax=Variovorax sp. DAIF25 TaxID=3080983 RepID=UPI003D6A23FE
MSSETPPPTDWKALEPLLVDDAVRALRALLDQNPGERFYAATLYGLYRELDGPVFLPGLAAHSLGALGGPPAGRFWEAAWNPPDWRWDLSGFESEALGAGAEAAAAAMQSTRRAWLAGERRCVDMLVSATKKIRKALAQSHPDRLVPGFVVFLHDEEGGPAWVRRCIGEKAFLALMPEEDAHESERRRVAALPEEAQAQYLVERLGRFEGAIDGEDAAEWLCRLGAPAVPPLLERLAPKGRAWEAASLLGRIGITTPEVLAALRRQASGRGEPPDRSWAARALAFLGDSDWLLAQLATDADTEVAIEGLCAPYSAFRDRTPLTLDYRPLEALLSFSPAAEARALAILKPGSSYCSLRTGEVDEALRGLAAPHARVRLHAASLMDDRGLGAAAGRRLLPALADRIAHDADAGVRWTALYSLAAWKRAGRPWHETVAHAARHDADERVRAEALAWLGAHGG